MSSRLKIAESNVTALPSAAGARSSPDEWLGMPPRFFQRSFALHLSLSQLWTLVLTWIFACACTWAQSKPLTENSTFSAWNTAKSAPHALVQTAIENEVKNSYGHRSPVRYLIKKRTRNIDTTKEIVETAQGGVARLVAIHNQPLNANQTQLERRRLQDLASDPSAQQHRRHDEERDAARVTGLMRLLPNAFINHFQGSVQTPNGTAIRMSFEPNPHFSPPSLDSRVLTGIRGEIWIDPTDLRVVHIEGRLFRQVDYGWGILGTLYPGGTIRLDQVKTPECGWQLAYLTLNMTGKALMLKSLRVVIEETASDYHPVPVEWKYTDAIDWLLHMTAIPPTATGHLRTPTWR